MIERSQQNAASFRRPRPWPHARSNGTHGMAPANPASARVLRSDSAGGGLRAARTIRTSHSGHQRLQWPSVADLANQPTADRPRNLSASPLACDCGPAVACLTYGPPMLSAPTAKLHRPPVAPLDCPPMLDAVPSCLTPQKSRPSRESPSGRREQKTSYDDATGLLCGFRRVKSGSLQNNFRGVFHIENSLFRENPRTKVL